MYTEKYVKNRLLYLLKNDPCIHFDVSLAKPQVEMRNVSAKIIGIYNHIFQIETQQKGRIERYSLQYGDVTAGIIKIFELAQ